MKENPLEQWPGVPAGVAAILSTECIRGFEKGLAGGGWRQTNPPKEAKNILQKCVPLLPRGHRKKGTEKRPESLVFQGFPRANPLCPPTPFRNF